MPYYYSPLRKAYEASAKETPSEPKSCIFCNQDRMDSETFYTHTNKLIENEHYRWVVNWFPRAEAHTMLIPKRHLTHIQDEQEAEILARQELLNRSIAILQSVFPESGMEVFLQTGTGSLSSIPHLHWHLVPTLPQHSLTGFEKIGFFSATKPDETKVVMTPIEITIARESLLQLVADGTKNLELEKE